MLLIVRSVKLIHLLRILDSEIEIIGSWIKRDSLQVGITCPNSLYRQVIETDFLQDTLITDGKQTCLVLVKANSGNLLNIDIMLCIGAHHRHFHARRSIIIARITGIACIVIDSLVSGNLVLELRKGITTASREQER